MAGKTPPELAFDLVLSSVLKGGLDRYDMINSPETAFHFVLPSKFLFMSVLPSHFLSDYQQKEINLT